MEDTKFLSATDIVGAQDFDFKEVEVPEWGGSVRLKVMSAAEAIKFMDEAQGASKKNSMLKLLMLCIVGADGKRVFTDDKMGSLGGKSLKVLRRLQDEAIELNGLNRDDRKKENPVEEAKND